MQLILASNSPRRKEILTNGGYEFKVWASSYQESSDNPRPEAIAINNASGKAKDVFSRLADNGDLVVLGADTIVCYNGKILGKPTSERDAADTLKELSDNTHTVITWFCIISSRGEFTQSVQTQVTFNKLSNELIRSYVQSGLPMDKAGSYGIQDGFPLVKSFNGSLTNVIGLPKDQVFDALKEFGVYPKEK